jgi:cell wall-associated NlpC family hydrolase
MTPLQAAGAYVGAPYRLHGRDEAGWDCWGLVAALRGRIFGRPTPSWSELYGPEDGASAAALAEKVERLIRGHMAGWTPCAPRAGAVALLTVFGREAHVGLMLGPLDFIHVLAGSATAISRLNEPRWRTRFAGAYDA